MQDQAPAFFVGILVEVVDPVGIEQRGPALDAVDLIAFLKQKFRQVGAVLAGDPGYQGFFD